MQEDPKYSLSRVGTCILHGRSGLCRWGCTEESAEQITPSRTREHLLIQVRKWKAPGKEGEWGARVCVHAHVAHVRLGGCTSARVHVASGPLTGEGSTCSGCSHFLRRWLQWTESCLPQRPGQRGCREGCDTLPRPLSSCKCFPQ